MNTSMIDRTQKFSLTLSIAALMFFAQPQAARAGTLTISRPPLFVSSSADPNIAITFDDSGSMHRGYVPDEMNDAAIPETIRLALGYPVGTVNTRCWWQQSWSYSSAVNTMYFNPSVTYFPPKRADGTSFPDAVWPSAWEDGIAANTGGLTTTRNLATAYQVNWGLPAPTYGNGVFKPAFVAVGAATSACTTAAPFNTETATLLRPTAGTDNKAFYFQLNNGATNLYSSASYTVVDVTLGSTALKSNFANWYSYYRSRNLAARSAMTRAFDAVSGDNLRVVSQYLNNTALPSSRINNDRVIARIPSAPMSSQRTQLFDFFYNAPASGGTPIPTAFERVGSYFGQANSDLNNTNPYWEVNTGSELSCRQNYHITVTDGGWNGTTFDKGNPDSIGVRNLPFGGPIGGPVRVYTPNSLHTRVFSNESPLNTQGLADSAFHYWATDLRTNLPNTVPRYLSDPTTGITGAPVVGAAVPADLFTLDEVYFNPANDPADWQHLVQYIVAFGLRGSMGFPNVNRIRQGLVPPGPWPFYTAADGLEKVDDTWHAAINSRGKLFSASNPNELVASLSEVFQNVSERVGSSTPITVSSGLLGSGVNVTAFRAGFNTGDWGGLLVAVTLDNAGGSTQLWEAGCQLTGASCNAAITAPDPMTGRKIVTSASASGTGVPFQTGLISAAQNDVLNRNPSTGLVDGLATQRLRYIRGVRTDEAANGGIFRNRNTLLGAIVNSAQRYVQRPREVYVDDESFAAGSPERASKYSNFVLSKSNRVPTLYIGANDGMLHAFNTDNGAERWAYIPHEVSKNLNRLTSQTKLEYQSFVDGTPVVRDVFLGGAWKTMLVGTLRSGGQGVFALDITDPDFGSESALASKVMWEFSDDAPGDVDMGYTFGTPFITKLHNNKWVVLVPGGYNQLEADGRVGVDRSVLFVLDASNGTLIRKITVPTASSGLSSVTAGDYQLDCQAGVCKFDGYNVRDVSDVAFAGDLDGALWRFDLTSASPSSWSVTKFFQTPTVGGAVQPITSQPNLAYTRTGRVVVLFGSGKFIEPGDVSSTQQQAFYGVFDQGPSGTYPITQSNLLSQTLATNGTSRTLTRNQITSSHKGWFFNFIAPGERFISSPGLFSNIHSAVIASLIPTSTGGDPCLANAKSFLMFVDWDNGGLPGTGAGRVGAGGVIEAIATYDTNGDGIVNSDDDATRIGVETSSYISEVSQVTFVDGGRAGLVLPGSGGVSSISVGLPMRAYMWRRRSWRTMFIP